MRTHDYVAEVHADGAKVALGTVSDFESELRKGRLRTRFVVRLAAPVDPAGGRSHSLSSIRPVFAERVEITCR